ncbi:GntR family transcriptional regulator [Nesterenkonia xinjiangensis]|uniref:DNA-binding GntR family transcriptional regulator n=1 Tax=Nesterenkonia xinjiangensis TaxID=225327 RepID=A0A7Z0GIG3_9MICC|nr:GntR family transcriptional regulator [Nesterenkonia xinjiangensis]NYJ76600.1 DNA-binding GntR family transcriptional regulator [Nesterenkonia xinjiangensis]
MAPLSDDVLGLIAVGEYTGGQWLREGALAERLGVSRTPVRDALRELAALGVLDLVPHRGARIREYAFADIEQIYHARARVEPAVVADAVPRLREDHLERLRQLSDRMHAMAHDSSRRPELSRLNNEFHRVFLDAADNRALASSALHLVTPLLVAHVFAAYSEEALARSLMHHDELILAAQSGDARWAEAIMTSHILSGLHGHRAAHAAAGESGPSAADPGGSLGR